MKTYEKPTIKVARLADSPLMTPASITATNQSDITVTTTSTSDPAGSKKFTSVWDALEISDDEE